MHVKLYEDIARHGHIATTYAYPVKVDGRYVMDPSPTPKFDNPKMNDCAALQLFGAGREKRIYAIPPYTEVVSLDFEDHPFERYRYHGACALCGSTDSFLDEVVTDDRGGRMFVCSDTDYCERPPQRRRERPLCRRPRSRAMLDQADTPDPAGGGRRPAAGSRSLCAARVRRRQRAAARDRTPAARALRRLSRLHALRRRAGRGHRRQLRLAGDAQPRPSRRAVGDRRGCRGRADVCRATASARP